MPKSAPHNSTEAKPRSLPSSLVLPTSLVEKAREIEEELAKFLERIKLAQVEFDQAVADATLRGRDQAAVILDASTDQVGRWSARGELTVVDLDRRPRYRLRDLEAFAAARVRRGRRSPTSTQSDPALLPKHEKRNLT